MRERKLFIVKSLSIAALACALWAVPQVPAYAQVAPDPTLVGPLAITSAEYRLPATVDPNILSGRFTEVWARVYRPTDLSGAPYPVLVFLHGNHATCGTGSNPRRDTSCQYTSSGTCPAGFVVVPNHMGYSYLAERLASWGYVVVSINANRGITCGGGAPGDFGLNLARGRLVLKHIQKLSEWNNGIEPTPPSLGVDLGGVLDFSSVGLLGHSRGGEGVRAAYNLYRDAGSPWPAQIPDWVNFQGIFEIGAVDGQTSRVLNADGTVWNQLLPMCDGDVSNLQGVKPFDRMMRIFTEDPATQKSTFTVWGANHNFYNTEWQQSDSSGCTGHPALFPQTMGSPAQRQTGLVGVLGFFRGNVGPNADWTFNQNFNPQFAPTTTLTSVTRVDRGYTDSPSSTVTTVFEDFDRPTGTSSYGFPNIASSISITHGSVPNHDPVQRAGVISWTAGPNRFFQTNWSAVGGGRDISAQATLDVRVSRQSSAMNPAGPTNFSIQLVMADETLSDPVPLQTYTDLRGPVGGPGGLHPILQTARIPLCDFTAADLTQVRGVRLTFDRTASGAIYVANIRLSNTTSLGAMAFGGDLSANLDQWTGEAEPVLTEEITQGNQIRIRTAEPALGLQGQPSIEVEVSSDREFPVRNELVVLEIGGQIFKLSRYPENGDTHTLIFSLTPEEFARTNDTDPVAVKYGTGQSNVRWSFGSLNKGAVNQ